MEIFVTKPVFVVALVVLAIVSLWVISANQSRYLFGVIFIPFLLLTSASTYFTIQAYQGFPTQQEIGDDRFTLHWYIINEPESILLWVTKQGVVIPRVYEIPYDKSVHATMDNFEVSLGKSDVSIQGQAAGVAFGTESSVDERDSVFDWYIMEPQDLAPKVLQRREG